MRQDLGEHASRQPPDSPRTGRALYRKALARRVTRSPLEPVADADACSPLIASVRTNAVDLAKHKSAETPAASRADER
jgi:hypothetical protein